MESPKASCRPDYPILAALVLRRSPAEYRRRLRREGAIPWPFVLSRPGRGLHAGIGEEPQLGQVAACHEDSLGESLVLDQTRNPEPADAEG